MADLARALEAEGGRVLRAEARDIVLEDGRVTRVETDAGPLPCAAAVLAAGIWSGPIARKLGLAVPMVAERGYHLHFTGARPLPRRPLMITRGKFGATPMADGLRCAGLVELGGLDPRPSPRPLKVLRRHAARAFPGLAHEGAREWMGMRPSTADSLPVVGEIGRTGVHAAFGHQHVGLTAGPKTGRLVADMIAGRRPNLDMAPYAPARFGRGRPGD
jgi:D-amino-acid dehydrogenase